MQVFFYIGYLIIGFVQLFAVADGIEHVTNVPGFLAMIGAFLITYIPIVGSLAGVYGATEVWDWSLIQAGVLFFWYVPVFIIISIFDRG